MSVPSRTDLIVSVGRRAGGVAAIEHVTASRFGLAKRFALGSSHQSNGVLGAGHGNVDLTVTGSPFFEAGGEARELRGCKVNSDVGPFAPFRLVDGHAGDETWLVETA